MDVRPIWTDCDEAGDYVVPNVLSPRDLVSRPDIMDETVPHAFVHPVMNTFFRVTVLYRYLSVKSLDMPNYSVVDAASFHRHAQDLYSCDVFLP